MNLWLWEDIDVVKTGRKIIDATKPLNSEPVIMRGNFGFDSVESDKRKIKLCFK